VLNRLLCALIVLAVVGVASAGEVKVIAKFAGVMEEKSAQVPESPVITNADELKMLWEAWKLSDPIPPVNFKDELVIVTTKTAGRLDVSLQLDAKGNLKVDPPPTKLAKQGFRYVIQVIERTGIKSVNDKALKK
jgi:hypothetical protein